MMILVLECSTNKTQLEMFSLLAANVRGSDKHDRDNTDTKCRFFLFATVTV